MKIEIDDELVERIKKVYPGTDIPKDAPFRGERIIERIVAEAEQKLVKDIANKREKEEIKVGNPLTGTNIPVKVSEKVYFGFLQAMKTHNLSIAVFFNEFIDPIVLKCVRNLNVEKLGKCADVEKLLDEADKCREESYGGLWRRR